MVLKVLGKVRLDVLKNILFYSTYKKGQSSNSLLCCYYAGSALQKGLQETEKEQRWRRERRQRTEWVTFSRQAVDWKEQHNLFKLSEESERILGSLTGCNYMLLHLDERTEESARAGGGSNWQCVFVCIQKSRKKVLKTAIKFLAVKCTYSK